MFICRVQCFHYSHICIWKCMFHFSLSWVICFLRRWQWRNFIDYVTFYQLILFTGSRMDRRVRPKSKHKSYSEQIRCISLFHAWFRSKMLSHIHQIIICTMAILSEIKLETSKKKKKKSPRDFPLKLKWMGIGLVNCKE